MSRRHFGLAGVGLLGALAGCGQASRNSRPARLARVGFLHLWNPLPGDVPPPLKAFESGLRERGYVDGQNLILEVRLARNRPELYPELIEELLKLPVDVLVIGDSQAIPLAKQATTSTPIVMAISGDVVEQGIVQSLRRPGGNITGLTNISRELSGKRLELLSEVVPRGARFGVLWNENNASARLQWDETRAAAELLRVELVSLPVRQPNDLPSALDLAVAERVQAISVLLDPLTSSQSALIGQLAVERRLATMFGQADAVRAGALLGYGPDRTAMLRRSAYFVDRILRGTPPAELPIERPMQFEFAVNTRTAEALGITIPSSFRYLITEVDD